MEEETYLVTFTVRTNFDEQDSRQTIVQGSRQLVNLLALFSKATEKHIVDTIDNLGYIDVAADLMADLNKNNLPEDLDTGNFV